MISMRCHKRFGLVGALCSFFCIPIVGPSALSFFAKGRQLALGTAADHFGRRPLLVFSFLCSKAALKDVQ